MSTNQIKAELLLRLEKSTARGDKAESERVICALFQLNLSEAQETYAEPYLKLVNQ